MDPHALQGTAAAVAEAEKRAERDSLLAEQAYAYCYLRAREEGGVSIKDAEHLAKIDPLYDGFKAQAIESVAEYRARSNSMVNARKMADLERSKGIV